MSDEIKCWCHKCNDRSVALMLDGTLAPLGNLRIRMIVCPICGNKRCPHASDHELACTNSNEPGQKGSVYE